MSVHPHPSGLPAPSVWLKTPLALLTLVVLALLLGGCVMTPTLNADGVPIAQLGALQQAYPGTPFDVAVVSSDNFQADELSHVLIQWGWSNAGIEQVAQLLQKPGHPFVAVIGVNDELAAAIAARAMASSKGKAVDSSTLFFVGHPSLREALETQARDSGVNFRFVVYPVEKH